MVPTYIRLVFGLVPMFMRFFNIILKDNVVVPFAYDACSVPETYSRFDDFRSF